MNKHKIIGIISLILVLVLCTTLFVACNKYKQDAVSGGNADAAVTSNGGYYVKQGDYAYFINGYDASETVDNTFGTPLKNGIIRAELNSDGTVKTGTVKLVVPKQIYNTSVNGGFAVFGNWIYYATPNNDEDKSGNPSTTHTDFMRTSLDGTKTQLIATINTRGSEYFFTPTRILYMGSATATTVNYIDFSAMATDKSIDNGKGATTGVLIENASKVIWNYDAAYTPGQGAVISDYIVYTEKLTGDNSYEFYNNLCAIRYDGSDKKVLATYDTWLTAEEKVNYTQYFATKVFNFTLLNAKVESDTSMTLFYTKSVYLNSAATTTGLYSCTFDSINGFDKNNEKHLTNLAPTTVKPVSYQDGALVAGSDGNFYHVKYDVNSAEFASEWNGNVYDKLVLGRSATIMYVGGGTVFYYDGTGGTLYAVNLVDQTGNYPNETQILTAAFKTDWLLPEFDGTTFYFFDTADYNYIHRFDLSAYEGTAVKETTAVSIMTQADKDAKAAAEKEAEAAKQA